MKSQMLIIDTRLMLFQLHHSKQPLQNIINILYNVIDRFFDKTPHIIFAIDPRGGSRRRKEIYPEYKAHRKEQKRKLSAEEQKRLKHFEDTYDKLPDFLRLLGDVVKVEGLEADDIANVLVERYHNEFTYGVVLLSNDVDWSANLVFDNTKYLVYNKSRFFAKDTFYAYSNLPTPYDIMWSQYLAGCAKENVKGLFRFGEKTYLKVREQVDITDYDLYSCPEPLIDLAQEYVNSRKGGVKLPDGYYSVKELVEFNTKVLQPLKLEELTDIEKMSIKKGLNSRIPSVTHQMFEEIFYHTFGEIPMFGGQEYIFKKFGLNLI